MGSIGVSGAVSSVRPNLFTGDFLHALRRDQLLHEGSQGLAVVGGNVLHQKGLSGGHQRNGIENHGAVKRTEAFLESHNCVTELVKTLYHKGRNYIVLFPTGYPTRSLLLYSPGHAKKSLDMGYTVGRAAKNLAARVMTRPCRSAMRHLPSSWAIDTMTKPPPPPPACAKGLKQHLRAEGPLQPPPPPPPPPESGVQSVVSSNIKPECHLFLHTAGPAPFFAFG